MTMVKFTVEDGGFFTDNGITEGTVTFTPLLANDEEPADER